MNDKIIDSLESSPIKKTSKDNVDENNEDEEDKLQFRVSGKITKLLGRESVSGAITALYEVLKNSHDADAASVTLEFQDILSGDGKIIIRESDGDGMTFDDIQNKFFVIGTYSKEPLKGEHVRLTTRHKRVMLGRKGVGRFALERLGHSTDILSKPIDSDNQIAFSIDWGQFETQDITLDQIQIDYDDTLKVEPGNGLEIQINKLRDEWDIRAIKRLETEIQRLILPKELQIPKAFKIFFHAPEFGYDNKEISVKLSKKAYYSLQADLSKNQITLSAKIKNESVISTQQKNNIITEFEPFEYGSKLTKSEKKSGVKHIKDLTCGNARLLVYYFPTFQKGSPERRDAMKHYGEAFAHLIDNDLEKFSGVRIFRDGMREFTYGDPKRDWVERSSISRNLSGTIQTDRLMGFVLISNKNNPEIIPTTNRESAVENQAFLDLREFAIQSMLEFDQLLNKRRRKLIEERYSIKRDREALNQLQIIKKKLDSPKSKIRKALTKVSNLTGESFDVEIDGLLDAVDVAKTRISSKIKMTLDEMAENQLEKSLASFGYFAGVMVHETDDSVFIINNEIKKIKKYLAGTTKLTQKELNKILMNLIEPAGYLKQWNNFVDIFTTDLANENPELQRSEIINPHEKIENFKRHIKKIWKIDNLDIQNDVNEKLRIRIFTVFFYSIIGNLMTNAIKSINALDDRIERDNIINIKTETDKDYFILYFSDNSTGIPKERWTKIFDPHVSSTKKESIFKGHGIGLSIVHSILREYDGEIKIIEPHLGSGTTFKIRIPWKTIDPERIPDVENIEDLEFD